MTVKKLDQIKREYFQRELGVTFDSLYDLEKLFLNGLGYTNSPYIPDLERAFLQDTTGSGISDLSTLWNIYWDSLGVPQGRFDEREYYFYESYGFLPDSALVTENGAYLVTEGGYYLLYR